MKETIRHQGVVEQIGATTCVVRILQQAACGGCSVKQLCKSSESKEKLVEASLGGMIVRVGQKVMVEGTVGQGLKAVWIAYVVPLLGMVLVLFLGSAVQGEDLGALLALLFLIIYYGGLYLYRRRLNGSFRFRVMPFDEENKQ